MSGLWAAIETHPTDRIALCDGERSITYGELMARPQLPAAGPRDIVGDSSLRAVLEILDTWRAGDAVVLLHPRLPESEQATISEDIRSAPLPEKCRAVVATSGTTGSRRYVLLSEEGMLASARTSATNLGWVDGDRWWLCMPTAHVGGLAIVVRCLLAGKSVFSSELFSRDEFDRAVSERVTLVSLVPTMLHELLKIAPLHAGQIRAGLIGGGPCTPELARRAREAGLPILLTWGMSEAGSQIATQSYDRRFSTSDDDLRSVGRPLPAFEVSLRDGVGWVRGEPLSLGYHPPGRYPQPFDSDGWLESRDRIVELEDGRLSILGRGTDMILTGGENVYPAEVEAVLVSHVHIDAACVVGLPDERWGEVVVAVVVAGGEFDALAVLSHVRDRLGGYKTPRELMLVEQLPTNANGKVDRFRARELAVNRSQG